MGIKCNIQLFKTPEDSYRPGNTVRGVVKCELSEETLFRKITVSLKGLGKLNVTQTIHTGNTTVVRNYDNNETHVDIDDIVLDNRKGNPTPEGILEFPFNLTLPPNIPPSFKFKKSIKGYQVNCKIFYYVRIKFERPGVFKLDKRFKTKLNVVSVIQPTLPTSPTSYNTEKKPFQPFWQKDKIISINGTVDNSVTTPGGHVKIRYKVENATRLDIKGVIIKLVQEITFKCNNRFPDINEEVKVSDWEAREVNSGDTQAVELIMDIPEDVTTLQNSKLVSRNYFIYVVADLPLPHRNAILKMPIEILNLEVDNNDYDNYDEPPSYFEAMEEYEKIDLS